MNSAKENSWIDIQTAEFIINICIEYLILDHIFNINLDNASNNATTIII